MNRLAANFSALRPLLYTALVTVCAGIPALAQWTSQTIQLRAGWNSVFLEVQPEPAECDALFAGSPVESVWFFNQRFSSVQFIDEPSAPIKRPEEWLKWVPSTHELSAVTSLYILQGGQPYLVKTTNAFTWTIRGIPVQRRREWRLDSLNFVGFNLPQSSSITVQDFFANSPNLSNRGIFRFDSQGRWISNAPSVFMPRGEAFWIRATGVPDYTGPIRVLLERQAGLEFGRTLVEQTLRIRNDSLASRTITIRVLPSEDPAVSDRPLLAGDVPLDYWQNEVDSGRFGWTNLPSQLTRNNLSPGSQWEIRLGVRRRDMASFSPPAGRNDVLYQALLEIIDSPASTRCIVPVSAYGLQSP